MDGWIDETYRSASSFKPKWPTFPKIALVYLFSDFENLPAMKYFEGSEYDVLLTILSFSLFLDSCNSLTNLPGGARGELRCVPYLIQTAHRRRSFAPYKPSAAEERTTVIIDLRSH